jgi:hypothetical protein
MHWLCGQGGAKSEGGSADELLAVKGQAKVYLRGGDFPKRAGSAGLRIEIWAPLGLSGRILLSQVGARLNETILVTELLKPGTAGTAFTRNGATSFFR